MVLALHDPNETVRTQKSYLKFRKQIKIAMIKIKKYYHDDYETTKALKNLGSKLKLRW